MSTSKKAFVLMPFAHPYDSYYPAIFKPALEAVGYKVSRADDLFTPRPIMLDIQRSILQANLILCEMSSRNPNVFYELGLAHAIGKPAILVSHEKEDIPFDLRHVRVILYDYSKAGWESKLREDIKSAALAIENSDEIWPPSLIAGENELAPIRSISTELEFNIRQIDEFMAHNYKVLGSEILSNGRSGSEFRYITCMTTCFESDNVQQALPLLDKNTRIQLIDIYRAFNEINDRADALKEAFRSWRVRYYIEAIERFNNGLREMTGTLKERLGNIGE